jgi:signal transduction histidine kinase
MTSTISVTAQQPDAVDFDARAELIVEQAREDERRRIARDLHDDVTQQLTLLAIAVGVLREQTAMSDPEVSQRLDAVLLRAQGIGASLRRVSHQLHTSSLGDLAAAVRDWCQEIAVHYDLDVRVVCESMPPSLPGALSLALFRIMQEALQNIVKHSGARHAIVEISGRPDAVFLRIVDDGRGFDVESGEGGGMGLVSMRERLEPFDGRLSINSASSHGTIVEVCVPMWRTAPAAA